MKNTFFLSICTSICFFVSMGQRPPLNTPVGQHASKDTLGKENKPSIVSPAHTTVATPVASTSTKTLQELVKKMAELEAQVAALKNKLPFQDMAVITVEASAANIQVVQTYPYNKHQIRIDNIVSNNNPSAVVVAMKQSCDGQTQVANAFYNPQDRYWYISTPYMELLNVEKLGVSTDDHSATLYVIDQSNGQAQGLASAKNIQPIPGQKFSVIIFKKLP